MANNKKLFIYSSNGMKCNFLILLSVCLQMNYYLHLSNGYFYKNASILESEWAQYGTILSVVNKLKIAGVSLVFNFFFFNEDVSSKPFY